MDYIKIAPRKYKNTPTFFPPKKFKNAPTISPPPLKNTKLPHQNQNLCF